MPGEPESSADVVAPRVSLALKLRFLGISGHEEAMARALEDVESLEEGEDRDRLLRRFEDNWPNEAWYARVAGGSGSFRVEDSPLDGDFIEALKSMKESPGGRARDLLRAGIERLLGRARETGQAEGASGLLDLAGELLRAASVTGEDWLFETVAGLLMDMDENPRREGLSTDLLIWLAHSANREPSEAKLDLLVGLANSADATRYPVMSTTLKNTCVCLARHGRAGEADTLMERLEAATASASGDYVRFRALLDLAEFRLATGKMARASELVRSARDLLSGGIGDAPPEQVGREMDLAERLLEASSKEDRG